MIPEVNSLLDFTGKSVLVTGANRGIGRGIALRFAEAGANVGVHYHTDKRSAEAVEKEADRSHGDAVVFRADVTRKEETDALMDGFLDRFGSIDALINNAGIYPLKLLLDMEEREWEETVRADLSSIFFLTQAAAREMKRREKGGVIVNIASIEGENPAVNHTHYAAAKGGVIMHTKAAALELGQYNIRVNSVSPGLIWKEGLDEQWPDGVARYTASAPLSRLGMPDDIADACLFLASSAARWITGVNLRVDGGVGATPGY